MREFTSDDGTLWQAVALDAVVAHARKGAVLAFRTDVHPGSEPLRSTVTFNSQTAAQAALRSIGEKELRRRLSLARQAAGGV